jgi:hypothetical protein
MDGVKLRGLQGAVKRRKRTCAAFERGCIINATRLAGHCFTAVLQDNYAKLQRHVAIMHHVALRATDCDVERRKIASALSY